MLSFLAFNVFSFFVLGPIITAWLFIAEFIFTLAMALKCYPLQSGGILAIQASLFLLTSSIFPIICLSYGKMVNMAFPYTKLLGKVDLLGF